MTSILERIDPTLIIKLTITNSLDINNRRVYLSVLYCKSLCNDETEFEQIRNITRQIADNCVPMGGYINSIINVLAGIEDLEVDINVIYVIENYLLYLLYGNAYFEKTVKKEVLEKAHEYELQFNKMKLERLTKVK